MTEQQVEDHAKKLLVRMALNGELMPWSMEQLSDDVKRECIAAVNSELAREDLRGLSGRQYRAWKTIQDWWLSDLKAK